jgi:hypothetical protein
MEMRTLKNGIMALCAISAIQSSTAHASTVNGPISRSEVIARGEIWAQSPRFYSQEVIDPATGYRQDCSGFVSMALHLSPPGRSTINLPGVAHIIGKEELMQGDLIMNGGPGTGGDNGHVMIFDRWASSDHRMVVVYEQTPPHTFHHAVSYPGGPFKPYRYNNIVDDDAGAGVVHEVYADSAGWHDGDTGLGGFRSISAVNMGGAHPQAMAIKDGILHQLWGDDSGWHAGSTGIAATAVSAVNVGETWPRAMIVGTNSRLYEVYADASGWHAGDTGVQVKKISAVYMGSGAHPQVMATDNGDNLLQIWADNSGWHAGQTGIQANHLSAVNMGGVWPQVVVTSNSGHVVQVWADSSGWHAADTGTLANTVSAVNMGTVWPQIIATTSDGHLVQIWGDSAGWHSGDTGVLASNASAVNFGGTWPRIFTTR